MYSVEITGREAGSGETVPRRSVLGSNDGTLMTKIGPTTGFPWKKDDIAGPWDVIMHAAELFPANNCMGTFVNEGELQYATYYEVQFELIQLADGLRKLLGMKKGSSLGIMGKNRKEWSLLNFAANGLGLVSVPIYDTSDDETLAFILNHSKIECVSITSVLAERIGRVKDKCPSLKNVILMDSNAVASSTLGNLKVILYKDVVAAGSKTATFEKISLGDLSQIMYTSGTTGNPKGVMMLNKNIIAEIASVRDVEDKYNFNMQPGCRCISYLPNAHIFAQALEMCLLSLGFVVCFYSGNIKNVQKEMSIINPHAMPAVPRILSRFEEAIQKRVRESSFVRKSLFRTAFAIQAFCQNRFRFRLPFLDKLVFNKIRDSLFSNLRLIFSGSAPLSQKTQLFLSIALNCPVVQETCAAISATHPLRGLPGSIGGPLANTEMKLRSVDDMGYTVDDKPYPRGELLVRGSTIFAGYYENEEATKKDLDADGWFATGDIGKFNSDGSVSIIDRKKNIFKLSQGEYVSAEQLEAVYTRCKYLAQIWVYGDSNRSTLIAIGVPDKAETMKWAQAANVGGDYAAVANTEEFMTTVLKDLDALKNEFKLKGYERICKMYLETNIDDMNQGFSVEKGLVTPSLKLKRPQLKQFYQAQIDELYSTLA